MIATLGASGDALFSAVLLASRDAAVLALAVGLVLLLAGRRLPPAWRHALWLLVVARLLMPALPGGPLSWQRLLPDPAAATSAALEAESDAAPIRPEDSAAPRPDAEPLAAAEEAAAMPQPLPLPEGPPVPDAPRQSGPLSPPAADPATFEWRAALVPLWLAGACAYLLLSGAALLRFRRRVRTMGAGDVPGAAEAALLLAGLAREQGCHRAPSLRITRAVPVPAVSGLVRPEILLPPSTLERLDEAELRLVLLHELAHLRRRDLWIHWLLVPLQALHWFNPAVWWAFRRLRVEAEGAADAWALRRCGEESPQRYGETLLRLLETERPPRSLAVPGVVGVVESPRDLRSRIRAIARFSRRRNRLAAAAGAVLVAGIAAVGLTQAPREGEEEAPDAAAVGLPLSEVLDSPVTLVSEAVITVVDESGSPVEGAEVFVTAGNDHLVFATTPVLLRGRTDANGELAGRTAPVREDSNFGLHYVVAFKDGLAGFSWLQPKLDPETGKFDFAGAPIPGIVTLVPTGTVRARILRPDASPAAGLRVWVDAIGLRGESGSFSPFGNPPLLPGGYWQAVSDEDGSVALDRVPVGARVHLGHDQTEWAAFPGYLSYRVNGLSVSDEVRTLELVPAATISGRVLSPSGEGVANVVVEALEHHPSVNYHRSFAVSDADGTFRMESIPKGRYKLFSRPRGGHRQDFWVLDGGGSVELETGEVLVDQNFRFKQGGKLVLRLIDETNGNLIREHPFGAFLAGTVRDIDFSFVPPQGYHENRDMFEAEVLTGETTYVEIPFKKRSPADRIAGVVVDAAGNPVVGATIKCPSIRSPFLERMMAESDEAGRFEFDLPPDTGQVQLIAWHGDQVSDPQLEYESGSEVTLEIGGNRLGTVVGRVVDADGQPLPGSRFYSTGEYLPGIAEEEVATDADGRFRIAVVPQELVTFWISKDGYTKVARQGKVEGGAETDLGDIALEVADAFVAGQVVDAEGRPVPRASVRIEGKNQPEIYSYATDSEGRFRIEGVAEGWLFVEAFDHLDEGGLAGKSRVRSGSEDVRVVLKHPARWQFDEIVDFTGQPAPPLRVDHWYHTPDPDPDRRGKITMIRFVGKDRPLIYFSRTVELMQRLQAEFSDTDVEFLLVHGPWPREEVEEILAADHPDLSVPLAIESEEGAMSDAFGVRTRLTVVIDREGKVVHQHPSGQGSKAAVQELLDAEKTDASNAAEVR